MEIQENLCANAIRKIALLITKASELGMNLSGYGHAAEHPNNGNVYLWLEDYPFTLYIPLCADDAIHACWSSLYVDHEELIEVDAMTLRDLEAWADALNDKDTDAEVDAA
jgi:hypothetical protein